MKGSRLRTTATVLALVSAGLFAPSARAQQTQPSYIEKRTESGSEVWFPVDRLSGAEGGAQALIVKGRPGAARMGLMRPRLQFVTEMLKSVETL